MDRPAERPLSGPIDSLRAHLRRIVSAGIGAASGYDLVDRALHELTTEAAVAGSRLHVIAAGKAASPMARALLAQSHLPVATVLAVGTHRELDLPDTVEWHTAGHPLPDERSVVAARRALEVAAAVDAEEHLLLLLSGGASALLCAPIDGLTLDDKRRVVRGLINGGADIYALNVVRKHLSAVKGGRLAAACPGRVTTLAVSDVVGDDLSVIGSGPAVPDPSTWHGALAAYRRWTPTNELQPNVETILGRGVAGTLAETPKADHPALQRSDARIIGGRADAMHGAREEAERLGYHVVVWDDPIVGEARVSALTWLARAESVLASVERPTCIVSSGETTVRVTGSGKGGRNQEFALAGATPLASWSGQAVLTSVGTDGIDGPTDAAGAIADSTTTGRAAAQAIGAPAAYLQANDSYRFFQQLGDLILTGRTDTNVGDLQILLFTPGRV